MTPTYCPVWNWRGKKNKNGKYPIHIRIGLPVGPEGRYHYKYPEVELPQKVAAGQWADKPNAWVKNNHPFAFEINERIKEKLDILDKLTQRYYSGKKTLNFPIILRELGKDYNINSFNKYFDEYIKSPREVLDETTLGRYRSALQWLNRFNAEITFHDLSDTLFADFKKYCQLHAELEPSTLNGYFNAIKKVVYWSRKDNHITKAHQETVFEDVKISVKRKPAVHLEVEQVIQWRDHIFEPKKKKLIKDRDMFMCLIYTGYYYGDWKEAYKEDMKIDPIYGPYLWNTREKTENLAIVPLWKFPHALELIEQYKSEDPNDPYLIDRKYLMEDQPFNRNLKAIAGELKWTINVINKMGRTTNSQLWVRYGAKRPVLSKMLGHEKEETANHYYSINVLDVIEGTKDVDFKQIGL